MVTYLYYSSLKCDTIEYLHYTTFYSQRMNVKYSNKLYPPNILLFIAAQYDMKL